MALGNNLGAFLGGVTEQRTVNRQLGLQERQLGLEEEKAQRTQIKAILTDAKTNFDDLIAMGEFVKTSSPAPTPQLQETITGLRRQIESTAAQLVNVPGGATIAQNALAKFDAKTSAALTKAELAAADAGAGVVGAQTTAALLEVPLSDTAEAAGLVPEPKAADVINFRMPDGSFKAVDARDSQAVQGAINSGGVKVSLGVQAQNTGGLDATTRQTPADIQETRAKLQEVTANIEELDAMSNAFEKNPEAGGLLGTVIEKVGGLIQQIPFIGDNLAEKIGDPAEVKRTRTQARVTVSRLLTAITNESGKFTESERTMAKEALGGLDPTASTEQIQAAAQTVRDVMERSQLRKLNKLLIASQADLGTEGGQTKFYEVLKKNGFDDTQALDAIIMLQDRFGFN